MDRREKQIVQLLVAQPGQADQLRELFPVDQVQHPELRALTAACYAICDEQGAEADTQSLRHHLDDRRLDAYVIELCEGAPQGEGFAQALADVKASLAGRQRRELVGSVTRGLASSADDRDHLEVLRRMQQHGAKRS